MCLDEGRSATASSRPAYVEARTAVSARDLSMPDVIHSQLGMFAQSRGAGGTMRPRSAPGPGAGEPNRRTSRVCPAKASLPVTRCSMMAGTSDCTTSRLRAACQPAMTRAPLGRQGVVGDEAGRVVVAAEQVGRIVDSPRRAVAPALGLHTVVRSAQGERGRTVRSPGRNHQPLASVRQVGSEAP